MAHPHDELAVQKIQAAFPEAIEEIVDFRGERTLVVGQEFLYPICQMLRDDPDLQYNFLTDICADDMLPAFPRFAVNYQLRSMPHIHELRLRTFVEDPDEGPRTIGDIWKIGTWLEMEVYDLMGVRFAGNGALRRLFLPEDWVGFPLRKDYPLGYEEVQFSFNYKAIEEKKPYAGRKRLEKEEGEAKR